MRSFQDLNIGKALQNAIQDLGFTNPTPIQEQAYPLIRSGRNVVGISQTGTGKTLAFCLPVLQDLKFTNSPAPRILILVPTRELVIQAVDKLSAYTKYMNTRLLGIYGGTNINTQKRAVAEGMDILVATPGRLYDLVISGDLKLKAIKKLIIDEVDIMLDMGFRFQLTNIFDVLPVKRQNIMFSATMTQEVEDLIDDFFIAPEKIAIAVSGTPLDNIAQSCYPVHNFHTKANLLLHLLRDKTNFKKVLVFLSSKRKVDRLYHYIEDDLGLETGVVHNNKSQNYRNRSIKQFDEGSNRILLTTDVMARGLDLDQISHVINFDTPIYPENYMHRIGRTGRAEQEGQSILFYTQKEIGSKEKIEQLMDYQIPEVEFPEVVEINRELIPEEREKVRQKNLNNEAKNAPSGAAFHEKKTKNKKVNLGSKFKREIKKKYKKPKTRGDKRQNNKRKKR